MTKKSKFAKKALKHPEFFSYGELAYFQRWLDERKRRKALEKKAFKEQKEKQVSDDEGNSQTPESD